MRRLIDHNKEQLDDIMKAFKKQHKITNFDMFAISWISKHSKQWRKDHV
jgi:hypothetical protein